MSTDRAVVRTAEQIRQATDAALRLAARLRWSPASEAQVGGDPDTRAAVRAPRATGHDPVRRCLGVVAVLLAASAWAQYDPALGSCCWVNPQSYYPIRWNGCGSDRQGPCPGEVLPTPTPSPTAAPTAAFTPTPTPPPGPTPPGPSPTPTGPPEATPGPCGYPTMVARWDTLSPQPTGVSFEASAGCAGGEILVLPAGDRIPVGPRGSRSMTLIKPYGTMIGAGLAALKVRAISLNNGREQWQDIPVVLVWPCAP